MKLTKLAVAAAFLMAGLGAQVALADAPDERPLWEMLIKSSMNRAGMVTKSDFMKFMEQRFDAMDRGRRGMLTAEQIKRLLDAAGPM